MYPQLHVVLYKIKWLYAILVAHINFSMPALSLGTDNFGLCLHFSANTI